MDISIIGVGNLSAAGFQWQLDRSNEELSNTIASLRSLRNNIDEIADDKNMADAESELDAQINAELARQDQIQEIATEINDMLDDADQIDRRVAKLVDKNEKKFYEAYPPITEEEKGFWETIGEGWDKFCGAIGDAISTVKDFVVDFFKEHWKEILIGVAAIVVGAVLTVVLGPGGLGVLGAIKAIGVAAWAGTKASLLAAAGSAAIDGLFTLIFSGGNLEKTGQAMEDSFASGFMFGGLTSMFSSVARMAHLRKTRPKMTKSEIAIENNQGGATWNKKVKNWFEKDHSNVQSEITIKSNGPSGKKIRIDHIGQDKNGVDILVEAKGSPTAPYTKNQSIVYDEFKQYGGTVMGKGKGIYTKGYQILPTEVVTKRSKTFIQTTKAINGAFRDASLLGTGMGATESIMGGTITGALGSIGE